MLDPLTWSVGQRVYGVTSTLRREMLLMSLKTASLYSWYQSQQQIGIGASLSSMETRAPRLRVAKYILISPTTQQGYQPAPLIAQCLGDIFTHLLILAIKRFGTIKVVADTS